MSNFREMTPPSLQNGCSKKFQTLYITLKHNLENSNMQLLSRNFLISQFYEHFEKFREICFACIFAKFKYLAKQFILTLFGLGFLPTLKDWGGQNAPLPVLILTLQKSDDDETWKGYSMGRNLYKLTKKF